MERFYRMARGANRRFPGGNEPFQIVTRLLEKCGEVAAEVNLWEGTAKGESCKRDSSGNGGFDTTCAVLRRGRTIGNAD